MVEKAPPYEEPGIAAVLILFSFLYLLNVINHFLDQWIYCGLLGQVLIGVAWGTSGTQWLAEATQEAFTQLGYLGLLLLVYEGMVASRQHHRSVDWMRCSQVVSLHLSHRSRPTSFFPPRLL
jgi:hypothetical protein